MSDARDLLSLLHDAQAARAPRAAGASTAGRAETSILSFKAGKMNATLKSNGKYHVEPDLRRGEFHVVWATTPAPAIHGGGGGGAGGGHVKLEWRDRRTKTAVNTVPVFADDDATFERVETGRDGDRVYLLQCGGGRPESRHFFWMQDKDPDPDEENCVKVNLYLTDPAAAASAASSGEGAADATASSAANPTGEVDNAELLRLMQGALGAPGEGQSTTTVPGNEAIPTGAGALGNILENLETGDDAGGAAAAREGAGTAAAGGLTLGDLQSAMAGLNTASSGESAGEEEGKEEEGKGEEEEDGEGEGAEGESAAANEPMVEEAKAAPTVEEPTVETRLIVLVSNGVYDMVQASNQREALRLLDDLRLPYDQIDGMDPDLREKRNALFEASGIRGNYPQIFATTGTDEDATYLGGYEWLNGPGVEELRAIVPAGADAAAKSAEDGPAAASGEERRLTVLISNGVYDMVQASNQRDALRLLDDWRIPYDTIDGMDAELRERRNALFEISGIRGNYPQIFVESGDDGDKLLTFLGGYDWLTESSPEELNKLLQK